MGYTIPDDLAQALAALAKQHHSTIDDLLRGWLAVPPISESFQALAEQYPYPIARFDRNLRHTYVNPAYVSASGLVNETFIGKTHLEVGFDPDLSHAAMNTLRQVFEQGQQLNMNVSYETPCGLRHFDVRLMPEFAADKKTVQSVFAITFDISEQRRLRTSEEYYEAIVESQLDLICRYTPDTVLTYVNDAYCQALQKTREELIGTSYLTFSPPEQHASIRARIEQVLIDPSPAIATYRNYTASGAERWVQWVDHGITDEYGRVVEIQAVGRDITTLVQLEAQHIQAASLQAELAKERELMALKDQLTSILSHEFRTPLTVVRASTEMLKHYRDRMLPERIEEHLDRIEAQVVQMTQLMDDMLTLDRIRAGALELRTEPLDIVALCRSIVEHFVLIDDHHHHIDLRAELDDARFVGDVRYLNRVLSNLLSNAIKYSPAGTSVQIRLQRTDSSLIITVRDEGMGIPLEDQGRIFESFFRAKNAQPINGTGLGLAIARQHVEAHGGTITFQSTPGKGTTFYVRLPLLAG